MAGAIRFAILLLLLIPLDAAGSAPLQAASGDVTGTGQANGVIRGAVLEDQAGALPVAILVRDGTLTIKEETTAIGTDQAGLTPAQHSSSSSPLQNASISDVVAGTGSRLLLLGKGSHATASVDRLHVSGPQRDDLDFAQRASISEPDWHMATASSLPCTTADGMDIDGPNEVVFWGIRFTIHNATGQRVVETGSFDEPVAPGSPVFQRTQREAVVYIREGHVTFGQEAPIVVYLANVTLRLDEGFLALQGPTGVDPVTMTQLPADARQLDALAPFTAQISPSDGHVGVAFTNGPDAVRLDGVVIRASGSTDWWLISLLALVIVPVAGAAYSQGQLRRRLHVLNRLVVSKCFPQALKLAQRIRRHRPHNPDALVAETIGLLYTERYADAKALLAHHGWPAHLGPLKAYLGAVAAAGEGDASTARELAATCMRQAPELVAEVHSHPLLAPLLRSGGPRADGTA